MPASQGMLSSKATRHNNLIPVLICLALATLTVITFWSLKDCGFINLDDQAYVYANPYVQSGLNWNSITQAFSFKTERLGHWHPLTWLSLMLDSQIFGLNPKGFHLVNLLFHVMNTILLFWVLRRMTKALWPSVFVACLFAIHPLHVESVAWIVERKDVLSTFFWMLTMGAYSYYIVNRSFKRYFFVLLFFVMGLMSKPMLITLPFVLLLLDYWPLRRFQGTKPAEPEYKWSSIYPLLWEKVPLFALAILSSVVTYVAAQSTGSIHSEVFPFIVRIGNAFISYIAYMGKMIVPINLAVFYPYPGVVIPWQVLGSVLLLIAITLVVIWRAKRSPYLATGWLWYIGTLVPVIGIVQAGGQAMADRYTYIPLIGLFIMVSWGVPDLLRKWKYRKEINLTLSALIILIFSMITWKQVGYWQNSITLYDHTLQVTDNNWFIYCNRGNAYSILGNYKQAIEDLNRSIEIKPDYPEAYMNRGVAYDVLGNYGQALEDYNKAIEIRPGYALSYFLRGSVYVVLGNYSQALEDLNRAIEIKPDYAGAYTGRGSAYNALGNYSQALEDLNRAIEIKSDDAASYYFRGNSNASLGNYSQALEDYNRAIEINPDYANAYCNRAILNARSGKNNLAFDDFKKAAQLGDERARGFLRSKGISW